MLRKPDWLRVRFNSSDVARVADILKNQHLNTACHAANCPNMGQCFPRHLSCPGQPLHPQLPLLQYRLRQTCSP